jgi:hypothetical protein
MGSEKYQYCKIFVKSSDHELVKTMLVQLFGGTFRRRDLQVGNLELRVLTNSYAPDPATLGPDFVEWPVMIEIAMDDPGDGAQMVAAATQVVTSFWQTDLPAVTACDFEDELPWNGGIQRMQDQVSG